MSAIQARGENEVESASDPDAALTREDRTGSLRSPQRLAISMLISGIVGVICSMALTIERLDLALHPNTKLVCDVNPFVACGPVMSSAVGSTFGFPNPLIGIAGFSIVITIAMALLAGATFRRWFWVGIECGMVFAALFLTYLQYSSIFVIQKLCLWCMAVWAFTIPLVVLLTIWNLLEGHLGTGRAQRIGRTLMNYRIAIITVWDLVIIGCIAAAFGPQFVALMG